MKNKTSSSSNFAIFEQIETQLLSCKNGNKIVDALKNHGFITMDIKNLASFITDNKTLNLTKQLLRLYIQDTPLPLLAKYLRQIPFNTAISSSNSQLTVMTLLDLKTLSFPNEELLRYQISAMDPEDINFLLYFFAQVGNISLHDTIFRFSAISEKGDVRPNAMNSATKEFEDERQLICQWLDYKSLEALKMVNRNWGNFITKELPNRLPQKDAERKFHVIFDDIHTVVSAAINTTSMQNSQDLAGLVIAELLFPVKVFRCIRELKLTTLIYLTCIIAGHDFSAAKYQQKDDIKDDINVAKLKQLTEALVLCLFSKLKNSEHTSSNNFSPNDKTLLLLQEHLIKLNPYFDELCHSAKYHLRELPLSLHSLHKSSVYFACGKHNRDASSEEFSNKVLRSVLEHGIPFELKKFVYTEILVKLCGYQELSNPQDIEQFFSKAALPLPARTSFDSSSSTSSTSSTSAPATSSSSSSIFSIPPTSSTSSPATSSSNDANEVSISCLSRLPSGLF